MYPAQVLPPNTQKVQGDGVVVLTCSILSKGSAGGGGGGRYSTEEAFALPTQPSWDRIF